MSDWEIVHDNEWEPVNSQNSPKNVGWKGIGQDFISLIKNSPEMLEKFAQNIIEGTPGQLEGLLQNPERIPQGLFSGLLSAPHGIAAAPSAIGNYLSEKEIISPEASVKIPRPPFSPHQLAGLENEMPGDVITGLLGGFASGGPIIPNIAKGIAKDIKNTAQKGAAQIAEGQLGQTYRGVSNTRTGEVLKEGYKKELEKSKELYSNLNKSAKEKGIKEITHNIPQKDIDFIKDIIPESYLGKFEKALKENNFENFHEAQSELLKYASLVEKRAKNNPEFSPTVKEAGKKAGQLSEQIQRAIEKELLNKGGMDLYFDYLGAGQNYAQNVVPWWDLPSIKGAIKEPGQKGYRFPSNLPGEAGAKKANAFLSGKGAEYPELMINRKIHSPYAKLLETLAGLGMFGPVIRD